MVANLIWIPRILTILFIIFMMLFSLDVFDMQLSFWKKIAGFFIHSLPSLFILAGLLLTWQKPFLSGIIFITFFILSMIRYHTYANFTVFIIISLLLLIIGIFYIIIYILN